jgi:probable HAF family extracellular repeat protein
MNSFAAGVSGNIVVGYSDITNGAATHAFAYNLGAATPIMQDLGTIGGTDSFASAVSGTIVVGSSSIASGASHAFAYNLGAVSPTMQDLGTLGGTSSSARPARLRRSVPPVPQGAFPQPVGPSPSRLQSVPGRAEAPRPRRPVIFRPHALRPRRSVLPPPAERSLSLTTAA